MINKNIVEEVVMPIDSPINVDNNLNVFAEVAKSYKQEVVKGGHTWVSMDLRGAITTGGIRKFTIKKLTETVKQTLKEIDSLHLQQSEKAEKKKVLLDNYAIIAGKIAEEEAVLPEVFQSVLGPKKSIQVKEAYDFLSENGIKETDVNNLINKVNQGNHLLSFKADLLRYLIDNGLITKEKAESTKTLKDFGELLQELYQNLIQKEDEGSISQLIQIQELGKKYEDTFRLAAGTTNFPKTEEDRPFLARLVSTGRHLGHDALQALRTQRELYSTEDLSLLNKLDKFFYE